MKAVILTFDHWHLGFLGCYGNLWIETPHWDRLAARSVVFDQHFGADFCSSSVQHAWWTGCYQFPRSPDEQQRLPHFLNLLREREIEMRLVRERSARILPDPIRNTFNRVIDVEDDWETAAGLDAQPEDVPFVRLVQRAITELESLSRSGSESWLLWLHSRGIPSPWVPPRSAAIRYLSVLERLANAIEVPARRRRRSGQSAVGETRDEPAAATIPERLDDEGEFPGGDQQRSESPLLSSVAPEEFYKLPRTKDSANTSGDEPTDSERLAAAADEWERLKELWKQKSPIFFRQVPAPTGEPMEESSELAGITHRDWQLARSAYAGMAWLLDQWLGRLVTEVDRHVPGTDLLFVVTAATGDSLGEKALLPEERADLREERSLLAEELVHTPLLIRQGGAEMGTRRADLVQTVDLAPTLLEWFDISPALLYGFPASQDATDSRDRSPEVEETVLVDTAGDQQSPEAKLEAYLAEGRSLLPIVRDQELRVRDYVCFGMGDRHQAIRTADFLLIRQRSEVSAPWRDQLYIKPDDVWEMNNLARQYPVELESFHRALNRFLEAVRSSEPSRIPPLMLPGSEPSDEILEKNW